MATHSIKPKVNPKLKLVNVNKIKGCIDPASGCRIGDLSEKDLQRALYINNIAVLNIQEKYEKAIAGTSETTAKTDD